MAQASSRPPLRADEIVSAIDRVITARARTLVIHSSMPALAGTTHDVLRWQVVQAMRCLVQRGCTLVFPAFTFSYGRGKPFRLHDSPSETGVLPDWVRALAEAHRTPNPIFSFVVLGEQWPRIAAADHTDAYGDNSVLALLEALDAEVVMLGAKWDCCSFLHRMEQEHRVPYREFKHFNKAADLGAGMVDPALRVFVRRGDVATRLNFGAVKPCAEQEGLLRSTVLGASQVQSIRVQELAALCRRHMAHDPLFLLLDKPQVAHALELARYRQQQPAFRIALLGTANVDMLRGEIEQIAGTLIRGRQLEFYVPPYAQAEREVLDPASALHSFAPQLTVFCDIAESLLDCVLVDSVEPSLREKRLQRWLAAVRHWLGLTKGRTAVLDPLVSRQTVQGSWVALRRGGAHLAIDCLREDLRHLLIEHGGVLIDTAALAAGLGEPLFDARLWYLARTPWSLGFSRTLAGRIGGLIAAETGQAIRLIVVDLDNTLWGGVVGEDGPESLVLGGDGLGRAFCDFQAALRLLSQRGIALAIASKNDEAIAWEVIEGHPAMVLRRQDFAAWQINWDPKPQNIAKIAAGLNLSLSNVLFIDDNPVERRAVQQMLPAVRVLQIGADPVGYVDVLMQEPLLEAGAVTAEDMQRTASFQRMDALAIARSATMNHAQFVAELAVVVRLRDLIPATLARAAQLMAKTNQFNSSMRRYDQEQLRLIVAEGGTVTTLEVRDALSPPEILGLVVIRAGTLSTVDCLVLSCRTLGKGVETALLRHLARKVRQRIGCELLVPYTPSPRNDPVRQALRDAGFSEGASGWQPGTDFDHIEDLAVAIEDGGPMKIMA